jgi:hypothetical protein
VSWPPPNYRPDYGTGYRVTLEDFCRLVSDPYCRPTISPLLRDWFGCEITGDTPNLREIHERIRSDPERQYTLYQRAMDLWR